MHTTAIAESGYRNLPLSMLDESSTNPHRTFEPTKLVELAHSLTVHGLIQPITVRSKGEHFEAVAGARPFRAAQIAELANVPTHILEPPRRADGYLRFDHHQRSWVRRNGAYYGRTLRCAGDHLYLTDYEGAWGFAATGTLISVGIATAEQISLFTRLFTPRGLINADLVRTSPVVLRIMPRIFINWFSSPRTIAAVLCVRLLLCIVVLLGVAVLGTNGHNGVGCALLALLFTILFYNLRVVGYGQEGSDQLAFIILSGLSVLIFATRGGLAYYACGVFVVAQVVLCYVSSGVSKLVSPTWRSGEALRLVTRLVDFRVKRVANASKTTLAFAAWSVIVFETTFPAVFVGNTTCLFYLFAGAVFHISVGLSMGFNKFLLTFLSAYPLVVWAVAASAK